MVFSKSCLIALLLLLTAGCATSGGSMTYGVSSEIQRSIGIDFFDELNDTFLPNKLLIQVDESNVAVSALAEKAQGAGFGVSRSSGEIISIDIFKTDEVSYLAVLTVGELRRFTKRYLVEYDGLRQIGSVAVGG